MGQVAVRARLGLLLALLGLCLGSSPALGQVSLANVSSVGSRKAVSYGFYYGVGKVNLAAAPDNASNEVKGYTDALPDSVLGTGLSFLINYGQWGLIFGGNDNKGPLNKYADINQTPSDASDDVFVKDVHRINTSITIVFQPVRYLFLGAGRNIGSLTFDQVDANGRKSARRVGYENDFVSLGLAFGFNPETTKSGPILAIFTERPLGTGKFNGTIDAIAVGWYF